MNSVDKEQEYTEEFDAVKNFVTNFFQNYYTERCLDKVLDAFSDNVIFVGPHDDQVAYSKEECRRYIQLHMDGVTNSIPYFLMDYAQNRQENGTWSCLAALELNVVTAKWGTVRYDLRITLSVVPGENGWQITLFHVSEGRTGESDGQFHYRCPEAKSTAQRELGRIMSQIIPGGVISCYVKNGSPVSIINEECLRMLHHATFYDFMEDCGSHFENIVHPDDLETYRSAAEFISSHNKQCEISYRIRCREGNYIWVRSIGRKAQSTDGKDLIVSMLIDASQQVEYQKQLEYETETDPLTSVYNRRGAERYFRNLSADYHNFAAFILDIDNFKQVNDLYGHREGDNVLRYLAVLLFSKFGERGIVCRHGGDEFSVFTMDFSGEGVLLEQMNAIRREFNERLQKACPDAHATLSIGGIYGQPPFNIQEAFEQADANMYRVKKDTKDGIHLMELSR